MRPLPSPKICAAAPACGVFPSLTPVMMEVGGERCLRRRRQIVIGEGGEKKRGRKKEPPKPRFRRQVRHFQPQFRGLWLDLFRSCGSARVDTGVRGLLKPLSFAPNA